MCRSLRTFIAVRLAAGLVCASLAGSAAGVDDESIWGDVGDPVTGSIEQLGGLDLEGLMSLEITSVSKQKQKLAHAAAAVSVITGEEIRRSGMTSIPELLRLAPGVHVAQYSANQWAIGTRGFNAVYQNKLLVVMDGRTLYDPTFSGVNWESVDYMLEDLERIEVVRGPGATMWGANAVNGVININTKSARDTQGWLFSGQGSNTERLGGARYGGKIDDQTFYRIYTKYRTNENFPDASGQAGHDGWDALRGGFRIDRYSTPQDTLTLQGDFFTSRLGETNTQPSIGASGPGRATNTIDAAGGHLLGRWTHVISPDSDFGLQFYYDRYQRHQYSADSDADVWDIDFQHRFALGKHQEIIWGVGYRYQAIRLEGVRPEFAVDPSHRRDHVASAFIQDDITIVPDRLHLILGSKFEHNSHTGFEVQPGIRAIWTPDAKQTLWGSVSRAIRTPSNYEDDATLTVGTFATGPGNPPGNLVLNGNSHLASETLLAFELGYRLQPRKNLTIDVTGFYNTYQDLVGVSRGAPTFQGSPSPRLELPLTWQNNVDARSYGFEVAANWNITDQWRVVGSYSWMGMSAHGEGAASQYDEHSNPRSQAQIRTYYNVNKNIELNAAVFYTEGFGETMSVPSLVRVDLGVNWRLQKDMELSFGVRNLLDDRHPELQSEHTVSASSEVPRTIYMQLVWKF